MRTRYIQDPVTFELIPADEYRRRDPVAPYIVGDITPYKSMVTGEMIEGRRQHREHLTRHNVIEVGNAFDKPTPKPMTSPQGLKETIARVAYDKLRY